MDISRRRFCLTTAGIATSVTGASAGHAVAQEEIQVSGTVRSEVGADPAGTTVDIFKSSDPTQRVRTTIGSDGRFSASLPGSGAYDIVYINQTDSTGLVRDPDELPLVYFVTETQISESGDLGEFVLPEGHPVSIRCVTSEGDPIENLPVNFRAENGFGVRPGAFTTTPTGMVKFTGTSRTGVELGGSTTIEVQPPSQSGAPDRLQTISVSEEMEVEVTVPNPTQYPDVVVNRSGETRTATGTGTASESSQDRTTGDDGLGGRQRGFLSNSENEPAFLSNPFNLTTLGFLLSVGGIIHQMMGGS